MPPIARLSVLTAFMLAAGIGAAIAETPHQTEARCAPLRTAGEMTPEYLVCALGARGTPAERQAASSLSDTMREERARQAKAKCDAYKLSDNVDRYVKCVHHVAITVEARDQAVQEAAGERSRLLLEARAR